MRFYLIVVLLALLAGCDRPFKGTKESKPAPENQVKDKMQPKSMLHKRSSDGGIDLGSVHAGQIIVDGVPYTNSVAEP